MTRPLLTAYPHLRALLQNSALANTEFNEILNKQKITPPAVVEEQKRRITELTTQLDFATKQLREQTERHEKMRRLLLFLGEVIESQTHFTPYSEDVSSQKRYTISFSADAIRKALRLYWDLIAEKAEETFKARIPAKEDEDD